MLQLGPGGQGNPETEARRLAIAEILNILGASIGLKALDLGYNLMDGDTGGRYVEALKEVRRPVRVRVRVRVRLGRSDEI